MIYQRNIVYIKKVKKDSMRVYDFRFNFKISQSFENLIDHFLSYLIRKKFGTKKSRQKYFWVYILGT